MIPKEPTGICDGSSRSVIAAFKAVLDRAHLPSTVRLTRGRDIAAACGQLAATPRVPQSDDRHPFAPEAASPAVLTTYRKDGTALVTPVWFRYRDGAFEIVIAEDDVKLGHLRRDPRCSLVVFEAVRPFRGIEVRGEAELVECDVQPIREEVAGRYLGRRRFAAERMTPGVLLRLSGDRRVWNVSAILPS